MLTTIKLASIPTAIVIWNGFIAALPTVILVLTFVSVVISIGYTLWKWRKEYKAQHEEDI
jgi:hypothetical protein